MILRVRWLPFNIAGICVCKGLILILDNAPDSLIAHEQTHEKEWTPLWLAKYLLSPVFRMNAEVRAYTVQAKMEGLPLSAYYKTIRDGYLLTDKAKQLLSDMMGELNVT